MPYDNDATQQKLDVSGADLKVGVVLYRKRSMMVDVSSYQAAECGGGQNTSTFRNANDLSTLIKKLAEGKSLYDWHKELAMFVAMVASAFGRSLFGFALDALIHQRSLSRSGLRDPHTRSGDEGENHKNTMVKRMMQQTEEPKES